MALIKALLVSATVLAVARAGCPFAAKQDATQVEAFSSYTAQPLTAEELAQMQEAGNRNWCAIEIRPCDPNEGRRVDGSCTNPRYPTFGHGRKPFRRLLPAQFGEGLAGATQAKPNQQPPGFRQKRKRLFSEGRVEDQRFTHLLTNALGFIVVDFANAQDELNFLIVRPYCCSPEGANDPECVPNYVPDDDETLRFSNQRCMNMTRPISFQLFGCLPNSTNPEWINSAPSLPDLSVVYGETEQALLDKGRKFEGGLLKYEVDNQGLIWPPSMNNTNNSVTNCISNDADEGRCHNTPSFTANGLLGISLFTIWFWRYHNVIAQELATRNPCWNDDKLFEVARDINIALYQQMYYYEMFGDLMGRENLIKSNVLSASPGFRDLFDDSVIPQMSAEAPYVLRWVHTIQGSDLKLYDASGNYMKSYPAVNLTLHAGYLDHDNNLQGLTQGNFRQGTGAFDQIADPDMLTIAFGPMQEFLDVMTNDLSKNYYFGFPSYTKYREFCSGKSYKTFDDLGDNIAPEYIEAMKDLYGDVDAVELLAGIWMEKYVEGGYVPVTLYCILVEQLQHFLASDQHWYERPNRPKAFTLEQLTEVRKSTVALLLCTVGDTVTEIQPNAFRRSGPGNEMTSCDNIPKVNFDFWIDPSCAGDNSDSCA